MRRGSTPPSDALVLDADSRGGLAAVRALGRSRLTVTAAGGRPMSRYASARAALPDPAQGLEAFTDALVAHLRAHPAEVVLTASDPGVEALRAARGTLRGVSAVALAAEGALDVVTSKTRTVDVARTLGIPVPASIPVTSPAAAVEAMAQVGLPCVLKPDRSWQDDGGRGGRRVGSVVIGDPSQMRAAAERLVRPHAPALVQELVAGPNEWLMLFRQDGKVTARFAAQVARTWPPLGGSDVLRTSVALRADALGHAERLLESIGYDGFAHVEFRRTPDDRPVLMEVNPRFTQSLELACLCGIDFARMQVAWARGEPPAPSDDYRTGIRLAWAGGDLKLLAGAFMRPAPPQPPPRPLVRALAHDYRRRPHIDGLALDDPWPTLRALAATAGEAVRVLGARRRRTRVA